MNNLNFRDHGLKPFQSTEQYDEALTKGSKNGGVSAIIEEIPYIKLLLAKHPLKYTMIESSMRTSGFGFGHHWSMRCREQFLGSEKKENFQSWRTNGSTVDRLGYIRTHNKSGRMLLALVIFMVYLLYVGSLN